MKTLIRRHFQPIVAVQLLAWLVSGPWRDPGGSNFPQSIMFSEPALFATLFEGLRINSSVVITLLAIPLFWLLVKRSFLAYQLAVGGQAPSAARYAGFSARRTVWISLSG